MPNPLHSPEPESASSSQLASAGTFGAWGPRGIEVAAIAVAALYFGREVLIPVTLAMLLSFVLSPLVELLRRIWFGRILSVVLAVVLALGLIFALGSASYTDGAALWKPSGIPDDDRDEDKSSAGCDDQTSSRRSSVTWAISPPVPHRAPKRPRGLQPAHRARGRNRSRSRSVVTQPAPSVLDIGKSVLEPMLYPVATAGIILVVTIFALLQREDLRDRAIRLFGSGDLHRTTVAMDEAGRRLSRYFLTQLGLNASFGVIVGVGLYFIGVPNPLLWGILGALLRFVPYIGSWIAAALPVVLGRPSSPAGRWQSGRRCFTLSPN